jgi:hypothetical protein
MSLAQTPKASISDAIKQDAFQSLWQWSWDNQEVPVRPVGLNSCIWQRNHVECSKCGRCAPYHTTAPEVQEFETDAKELRDIRQER